MDRHRNRLRHPSIRFGLHPGKQFGGLIPTPAPPDPPENYVTYNGEVVTQNGEPVTYTPI